MVEHSHHVLVVNLMEELDLPHKVLEEFLATRRRVGDVLLAHEVLVDLLVEEQDGLPARALPEFALQPIVSLS